MYKYKCLIIDVSIKIEINYPCIHTFLPTLLLSKKSIVIIFKRNENAITVSGFVK